MSGHAPANRPSVRMSSGPVTRDRIPSLRPLGPISPAEREMLETYDAQRRLSLLWVIVPGLLLLATAALPFALEADLRADTNTSTLQVGVGLAAFALALWAIRTKRVDLASYALFSGVAGVIVLLILYQGPLLGVMDVSAIPSFALLTLPIALAGLLSTPRFVVAVMGASALFTLLTIALTPHTLRLDAVLSAPDGLVLFTVPIATQLAIGVVMLAATRGYRRIQRELGDTRVAYARERELDRLKDHFIASVNHELRTPIMALQGYLELAQELGARGNFDQQKQMLQRGTQATSHLAGLVRSVLDIRHVESDVANLRLAEIPLRPVTISAVHLLDPQASQGQARDIRLDIPAELAVVADEERVRQVLVNLLSNAVKYSPPGTPIAVSAQRMTVDARRRRTSPAPEMVEIAVRDYGLGVPPDQAMLLFQRFVRLERDIASPVVGTGLGLAICRAYVEAMGGRVWVESSGMPGEGSTFRFTLPAVRADLAMRAIAARPEWRGEEQRGEEWSAR